MIDTDALVLGTIIDGLILSNTIKELVWSVVLNTFKATQNTPANQAVSFIYNLNQKSQT